MSGRFTNLPKRLRKSAEMLAKGGVLEWGESLTIQSQLHDAALKIEALDRDLADAQAAAKWGPMQSTPKRRMK